MAQAKIIVVSPDKPFRELCQEVLGAEGFFVGSYGSVADCRDAVEGGGCDLLIAQPPPQGAGLDDLRRLRERGHDLALLLRAPRSSPSRALESSGGGPMEYLPEPATRDQILQHAHRLIERKQLLRERARLLAEGLEYLEMLSVYQKCTQLLATQDLSTLYGLILDSLLSESGGEGGILWAREGDSSENFVRSCSRGDIDGGSFPTRFALPHYPHSPSIAQGKPFPAGGAEGRGGLYIPLVVDREVLGLAYIMNRGRDFQARDLNVFRTLSEYASLAVRNALRLQRLSLGAMKERLAGSIYSAHYFREYVSKEILQAKRYQKDFSLLMLSIENYFTLSRSFRGAVLSAFVEKLMSAVGEAMRGSDLVARNGEDSMLILLPETDYFGSLMAARRIHRVLKGKRYIADQESHMPVRALIGSASFPRDGEDIEGLMKVLAARVTREKNSLYTRLNLEGLDFWGIVGALLEAGPEALADREARSSSVRLTPVMVDDIRKEIVSEIAEERDRRGLLVLAGTAVSMPPLTREHRSRVFLLDQATESGGRDIEQAHPSVTRLTVRDDRIGSHRLLLSLNEDYAYGLVSRPDGEGAHRGFHSDDPILIDNLIAKLHDLYIIQKEIG